MEVAAAKALGAGIAVIALAGVGIGIGNIFASLISSVARNPSARDQVFGLGILGFVERPHQVLDVMADFVSDDIGLGEIARRLEAARKLVEKLGVEIDLLVGRAVKRTHRRLRRQTTEILIGVGV